MAKTHRDLTEGGIVAQMIRMGIPMLAGTFSMTAFNLADTWFVSRLGTRPLAAMGFTFPIAMVMGSVGMALGTGTTVVVSQALGEGAREHARRIATDCLLLTLVVIECLALLGLLFMTPLLRAMNASGEVLPLARGYLLCYLPLAGPAFLAMPMNSVLRAAGDTRWPSLVMIAGASLNCILDPILIFGWGPFPALGIQGAAIATVISRTSTLFLSGFAMHHRYGLLARPHLKLRALLHSWGHVLHIATPALASYLLYPASMFIITGIVGHFGSAAVAAFGAGGRIEMFAYLIPMALGISLVPLVGQNYGAGRVERVEGCRMWGERLALGWGVVIALVFFACARPIASLFAKGAETERYLVLYLRIMPFGYGMREVLRYLTITLNAISRPMASLKLNALFLAAFNVPFAFAGAHFFGVAGIFGGIMVGSNLAGIVALVYGRRYVTAEALAGARPTRPTGDRVALEQGDKPTAET
jgi:putative MATE family efflux protein